MALYHAALVSWMHVDSLLAASKCGQLKEPAIKLQMTELYDTNVISSEDSCKVVEMAKLTVTIITLSCHVMFSFHVVVRASRSCGFGSLRNACTGSLVNSQAEAWKGRSCLKVRIMCDCCILENVFS
jgi:hypothetical protein